MRQQVEWNLHASFMNRLADEGFVFLGGPIADETRFLLIVNSKDERSVVSRLAEDPWTPLGLLTIASIEPWQILLGETRLEKRGDNSAEVDA